MSDDTTDSGDTTNPTPDAAAESTTADATNGATTQYDPSQAPAYRPAPSGDIGAPAIDFGDSAGASDAPAVAEGPAVDVDASSEAFAAPEIEQPDAADRGFDPSVSFGQAADPAGNGAASSEPGFGQVPTYGAPQQDYGHAPTSPSSPSQPVHDQAEAYGVPAPQPDYGQAPTYGAPQPGYGQAPTYGAPQPGYGQAPAYGAPQPGYGQQPMPPAYGQQAPGAYPAYGQQAPGAYPAYGYAQPPVTGTKYWGMTFLMYIPYVGWLVTLIVAFVQRSSAQKTGQPLAIGNANTALNFVLTYLLTQFVLIIAMIVIGTTSAAANPYDDDPSPLIALPALLILVVGIWALVMMIMGCVKSSRTVFTAVPSIPFFKN